MSPFKSIAGRALGKLLEGYKSSDIGKGFGSGSGGGGAVAEPFTSKMVLVGGGGGGSLAQGEGAGGAGGVSFFEYSIVLGTSYPVRVGNGGIGGNYPGTPTGADGEYSQWTSSSDYRVGEGGNGGYNNYGGNGNEQGGNGGGGGSFSPGGGGSGSPVPGPFLPYIFGGYAGGDGHALGGSSGGNQGGGGGGATANGGSADGPGTPGQVAGGNGGAGKEVPAIYLPDTFTQTINGPQPNQFLGMLITNPAVLRRTFGGGGGGGSEHGRVDRGLGGDGGGGHGGWGSPAVPGSGNTNYPPAGPTGQTFGPDANNVNGEPGYAGRGGGGGGGGYTDSSSNGGDGGGGVCIIQTPKVVTATIGGMPSPNYSTVTDGDEKYVIIIGHTGVGGSVLTGTVTFN